MQFVRRVLDKLHPHFDKGGRLERLYPLYEGVDSFLYAPGTVTSGKTHLRDSLDTKRMMSTVIVALLPCVAMAFWNTGYQANRVLESDAALVDAAADSWRGALLLAMGLDEGDELIKVHTTSGQDHVIIVTEQGQALRMSESDVRLSNRASGGIRSIKLDGDDLVVGSEVVRPKGEILVVTQQGFAKRTPVTGFPLQRRGGKGVKGGTLNDKTGLITAVSGVTEKDEIFVISREGLVVRTAVNGVSKQGRASMGVKLMKVAPEDEIVGVSILRAAQPVTAGGNGGNGRRRGKKAKSS